MVKALQGSWVNIDCPGERYAVAGHNVTRTDGQGSRHFTLHWDNRRKQLQWGTRGRLYLTWLDGGSVAWVPPRHNAIRAWRWRKVVPPPPASARPVSPPRWCPPAPGPTAAPDHVMAQNHSSQGQAHFHSSGGVSYHGTGNAGGSGLHGGACTAGSHRHLEFRHGHHGANSHYPQQHHQQQYAHQNPQQYSAATALSGGHGPWRRPSAGHRHRSQPYGGYHASRGDAAGPHGGRRGYGASSSSRSSDNEAQRLACGLCSGEVFDLLFREITPEDYDMLLRLDETVTRQTASASSIDRLPTSKGEEVLGEDCCVCLAAFETEDVVATLPCRHRFHQKCIAKWLGECRKTCPMCGEEALIDS